MQIKLISQFILAMNLLSRPQGATIKQLAEGLEVSEKTARRLIDNLPENVNVREAGPDHTLPPRQGETIFYHLDEAWLETARKGLTLSFSSDEIWLLGFMLLRQKQRLSEDFEKVRESLFAKISSVAVDRSVFERQLRSFETIFSAAEYGTKEYAGKETILQELSDAIAARQLVRMQYVTFSRGGKISHITAEPLHLFTKNGGVYLLSRNPLYQAIRIYAVERIQTIEALEQKFSYPDHFDPEDYTNRYFGISIEDEEVHAVLEASAALAPYITERQWARGQTISPTTEGGCRLEFTVPSRTELILWILGKGPGLKVLAPEDLRLEVSDWAQQIAQANREGSGPGGPTGT